MRTDRGKSTRLATDKPSSGWTRTRVEDYTDGGQSTAATWATDDSRAKTRFSANRNPITPSQGPALKEGSPTRHDAQPSDPNKFHRLQQEMKHRASPVISSAGVHRTYIRPGFGLNFLRLASLPLLHFPFPNRTGSFFTNSYLHASRSILIAMFAKFIVVFLALSTFANAAPAMRTSKLFS